MQTHDATTRHPVWKLASLTAVVALAMGLMIGCSDDDDDNGTGPVAEQTITSGSSGCG